MTYEQCLEFLFSQLPMYQREGKAAYKADLSNTIELCHRLGNPQNGFKSVHIAGTNGKGSVSHMLASVFQECGFKTGLYTSPHLYDFRERIRINGEMISMDAVVAFVEEHGALVEDIRPSFFEWTVAMAFSYFEKEKVDMAIIETGMGGRLDSTNILNPELCIITNVSMDHQQFLGDSRVKIAGEKAGIIKKDTPVVIGRASEEIRHVFQDKAREMNARLIYAEDQLAELLDSDLKGSYQRENQRTALTAVQELKTLGYTLDTLCVKKGMGAVVRITGLQGRWQQISSDPLIIADIAHNAEALQYLNDSIDEMSFEQLHIVLGVVSDKEIDKLLGILPAEAQYYYCAPSIPRAMKVEELFKAADQIGLKGSKFNSVRDALNAAKDSASTSDLILVTGSAFVVAEVGY